MPQIFRPHLIEEVTNPLGHYKGQHKWETKGNITSCFNKDDSQTNGHSYHTTKLCSCSHKCILPRIYPSLPKFTSAKCTCKKPGHITLIYVEGYWINKLITAIPEGKKPLGRPRHRWKDKIRKDLREIAWGDVSWMHLAQDMNKLVSQSVS